MYIFLNMIFIFFLGSMIGWVLEVLFSRIINKKWINPGFYVGPYVPIYGFGLVGATIIFNISNHFGIPFYITILFTGLLMTLIELIGGLLLLRDNIRLWDYSDRWLNYKGLICPLYSFIWLVLASFYYFVLSRYVEIAVDWYNHNLMFTYVLGALTGIIIVDYIYSTNLIKKVKETAKENNIVIMYDQLKLYIKKKTSNTSFLFPIKYSSIKDELLQFIKKNSK